MVGIVIEKGNMKKVMEVIRIIWIEVGEGE